VTQPITVIAQPGLSSIPPLSDEMFILLREYIYDRTGIFFPEKKKYLLEGRLGKRIQFLRLDGYEEYLQLLKYGSKKEDEFDHLCEAVTINETFFYRNEPQFDVLEQVIIPELVAAKQSVGPPKLRIWSAACSTGEEPYTVALLYLEKLRHRFPALSVEIVGTDINASVLQTATKGSYGDYSVRNLAPQYLEKYFITGNGRFHLKDPVREMVTFQYHNLYDRGQMRMKRNFDIIMCRNVLIYFDMKSKIQVVAELYNNLNRGGYLLIGYSELLHGISSAFKIKSFAKTTAYKKE